MSSASRPRLTRTEYEGEGLSETDLAPTPWVQARAWVDQALARAEDHDDVPEPLAMSVATVDSQGRPNVRTVLMRFFDERGPGFVTNLESTKGDEIRANDAVAASLTWPALYRSIRFRGRAVLLGRDEVAAYFTGRPWGSRVGAWASQQSRPIASRAALEEAFREWAERYPDRGGADDVPVPDTWGGWRIVCDEVEFWAGRRSRLHDRLVYTRAGVGPLDELPAWRVHRRQP